MEMKLNGVIGKSISRKIDSPVRSRKNAEYIRRASPTQLHPQTLTNAHSVLTPISYLTGLPDMDMHDGMNTSIIPGNLPPLFSGSELQASAAVPVAAVAVSSPSRWGSANQPFLPPGISNSAGGV